MVMKMSSNLRTLGLVSLLSLASACSPKAVIRERIESPIQEQSEYNKFADISEYCFEISPQVSIAVKEEKTPPREFLKRNEGVEAAINGPYFGLDDRTEGVVFLANNHYFGSRKPEHTRGYFTINKNGQEVRVDDKLKGSFSDYWLVIGTHPMLVRNNKFYREAEEKRYSKITAPRSAIGTKNGKNICFAVSNSNFSMEGWANKLRVRGYKDAINLDGGPYSQLATREGELGQGNSPTRLVIFSYKK